jgi:citrate synthase
VDSWRSAITDADGSRVIVRGHDLVSLMERGTYADMVALLVGGRLPDEGERRLVDAMLIAIADHGAGAPSAATARMAASGNRQAPEAAVAAGNPCDRRCARRRRAGVHGDYRRTPWRGRKPSLARWLMSRDRSPRNQRLKAAACRDFGHRLYKEDPRTTVLFSMAEKLGKAGAGVGFMRALEGAVAETIKPLPVNVDGAIAGNPARSRLSGRGCQIDLHHRPYGGPGGTRDRRVHA